MALVQELKARASEHPEAIALVQADTELTYGALYDSVSDHAEALRSAGVGPRDRVLIFLRNSIDFVIAYYSIIAAGAVAVPVNIGFRSAELAAIAADCSASAVISASPLEPPAAPINIIAHHSGWEKRVLSADAASPYGFRRGGSTPWLPDDVCVILYTSGTTGVPKGVMLTGAGLVANASAFAEASHSSERDVHICALPLFHSFGATVSMNMPILSGGQVVIAGMFIPSLVADLAVEARATVFAGVPAMFLSLASDPAVTREQLAGLRLCISGGAPLTPDGFDLFQRRFGIQISEGYGLTEASPVVSFTRVGSRVIPGSVGPAIPGVSIRIVDDRGLDVALGDAGEIWVAGPSLMSGYYNMPDDTAAVLPGGWLRTGDIGRVDGDGRLYIMCRKKEAIAVGGYDVYPREVEEVLLQHPAVLDAMVFGVPNAIRGATVAAQVVPRRGQSVSPSEIVWFCRQRLVGYKVPTEVQFVDSVPRDQGGKPIRRLAQKSAAGVEGGELK